jgi:hypothetical protein
MLKADADNQHELPSAPGAGAIKIALQRTDVADVAGRRNVRQGALRLRFKIKGRSSKARKNPTGSNWAA